MIVNNIKKTLKKNTVIKTCINVRNKILIKKAHNLSRQFIRANELSKFKQQKKGKRCFIIGNGPSLTLEDLNLLKNEDCFATNSIYKLFGSIDWRPTYYVSQDLKVIDDLSGDLGLIANSCPYVFLNSYICNKYPDVFKENNVFAFFVNTYDDGVHFPGFSFDMANEICEGYTVTYACIQMAVYMGYSKIYILGCDHNYAATYALDGSIRVDNSVNNNYMSLMDHKLINLPRLDKTTLAYMKARTVCENNNIEIYNSTRGGKLEVFERKSFDDLF